MINIRVCSGGSIVAEYLNNNFEVLYTVGFFNNSNAAMTYCIQNYPGIKIYNRA